MCRRCRRSLLLSLFGLRSLFSRLPFGSAPRSLTTLLGSSSRPIPPRVSRPSSAGPPAPTKPPNPTPLAPSSSSPSAVSLMAFSTSFRPIGVSFAFPSFLSTGSYPRALLRASRSASLILRISSFRASAAAVAADEVSFLAYHERSLFFCQRPTGAMREWPR